MFPLSFKSWPKVVIEVVLSLELTNVNICKFREIVNILEIKTSQLKKKINVLYVCPT